MGWKPTIELNRVVLPEPLGPINPTILPLGTVTVMLLFATTPPNVLVTSFSSRIGVTWHLPDLPVFHQPDDQTAPASAHAPSRECREGKRRRSKQSAGRGPPVASQGSTSRKIPA